MHAGLPHFHLHNCIFANFRIGSEFDFLVVPVVEMELGKMEGIIRLDFQAELIFPAPLPAHGDNALCQVGIHDRMNE